MILRSVLRGLCLAVAFSGLAASAGAPVADAGHSGDALPRLPRVAVLGVACAARDKEWREGLVGFGVEAWVAQAIYDSGQFTLVEENPELLGALVPALDTAYERAEHGERKELARVAGALHADLVLLGRVADFHALPDGLRLGPFSMQRRETHVQVQLCLFDARSGKLARGEGLGRVTRSRGMVGADTPGNKLPFDATSVAPATQLAVERAVARIVPGYRPRDRGPGTAAPVRPLVFGVLPMALAARVGERYPELRTKRVSMGVHNRMAAVISASPQCRLQEINPEVLGAVELQHSLRETGAPPPEDVGKATAGLAGTLDWVVYGEVFSFAAHQRERLQGLSGQVSHEVVIGIQLRAVRPGQKMPVEYCVASGIGRESGDWEAWKGSDLEFELTFVGRAARHAVESAWKALLHDLSERAKKP